MADLIDRGALREKIDALDELMRTRAENEDKGFLAVQVGVTLAACEVDAAPTVDAETVRRGRWIERHSDFVIGSMQYHHDWLVCSVCGRKETDLDEREETKETLKYCHCGARMDEVGE